MSAFGTHFQRRRLNDLTVFEASFSFSTCLNISFGANDQTKDAKHQEKLAASVFKPTLSRKHVLFFSSTKNILFPNETLLGQQNNFHVPALTSAHKKNFSGAHNSRAFSQSHANSLLL